jgi:hypothetical protein
MRSPALIAPAQNALVRRHGHEDVTLVAPSLLFRVFLNLKRLDSTRGYVRDTTWLERDGTRAEL